MTKQQPHCLSVWRLRSHLLTPPWLCQCGSPRSTIRVWKGLFMPCLTPKVTVFIDQEVSHSLQGKSHPVRLKLTTMIGKDELMHSERVSGLRERGYSSTIIIDLPTAYTKDCIPVNRTHIPTCETVRYWNHLTTIADETPPKLECEVGLLIGYNCYRIQGHWHHGK